MNDLTLKEVLLAEAYEKEIDKIKAKQKQFIEWVELQRDIAFSSESICTSPYSVLESVLIKSKELLK